MNNARHVRVRQPGEFFKSHEILVGLAVAAAAAVPLFLFVALWPNTPVLPTLSLLALATAATVALIAWLGGAQRHVPHVTVWDVAGGLALIGFAAGMLSEPNQILELFGLAPTAK